jgi:hypothetical protein
MKILSNRFILLLIFLLVHVGFVLAKDSTPNVSVTYTSNKTQAEIIILKLNPDKSAIIESWYNEEAIVENGKWTTDEQNITVTYKDFVQEFSIKKLFLFEYGSFKRIRGLKPHLTKGNGGFLDSVKFVDKDILDELIKNGAIQIKEKTKPGYINYLSIIFVTFFISAFVGRKKPILFAIISMLLVPATAYLIDELHPSLPIFTLVGFIFTLLWSMIFRWVMSKTRVRLDSKLKFLSGFSSGKGTRSFFVIGPKGSKSRD